MALALLWLKFGKPVSTERTSLRCFHMVGEAEEKETETTARWGGGLGFERFVLKRSLWEGRRTSC